VNPPTKPLVSYGLATIGVAVILVLSLSLVLGTLPSSGSQASSTPAGRQASASTTLVKIPEGSYHEPDGFNVTKLIQGDFPYPWNFTVVVGVNNTIEWTNQDIVEHSVTSFVVPAGAQSFDSDLIQPKQSFSTTLTVPGVYKYTCMWHPWLAGEIIVKPGR
jgi:plastocyanin